MSGIPNEWKFATMTMIPKKGYKSKDPADYRPISITSCLGKLAERLIRNRLYSILEDKKILVKQQSGFRNNKGASDNLLFFTQKISETIQKNKKLVPSFLIYQRPLTKYGTKE